jgi:hypothetical protein
MDAIRIETLLEGETLYLPQLRPLVGKSVEIVVREKSLPVVSPRTSEWSDIQTAVLGLADYDFDAYRKARVAEVEQAEQPRP